MPNMYIYSWLSHSMVHIPPQNDPNHICFFVFIGEKNGGDHPVEAGKKKNQTPFKEALDFIGILFPFKCPENQGQFPYQNFIHGANGEAKVKIFISRSVLTTFGVHTVTWRSC